MPHEQHMTLGEDVEFLAGATGAIVAVDQIAKSLESEDHTVSHLSKAAIGAAVAIGAYELLRREKEGEEDRHHSRRRSSSVSNSSHHERHLVEEIVGAYGLGKELMGDKRHHLSHLVEQAVGAVGFLKDAKERSGHEEVKAIKNK